MRKILGLLVALLMLSSIAAFAQDQEEEKSTEIDFSVGSDVVSRYVWRGTDYSMSPSIQPAIEMSTSGFAVGFWGSYSFTGFMGPELDFYLSYTFLDEMLTVTVTDYFFPTEAVATNRYFIYEEDRTGHIFEGSISFNGTENLPLSLMVAANFYGDDARKINDDPNSPDFNTAEGIQYSTYIELGYSMDVKETALEFFAGFTPNKPADADAATGYIGESGFYGHTMGFVNLGLTASKEINITEQYSLPVYTSVIFNPMAENAFLVFGFTF